MAIGSRVLVLRLSMRWARELVISSVGVFLKSINDRCGSCFVVLTLLSAFPLDCGYLGEALMCSKLYYLANLANSSLANWGPLSVVSLFGNPYPAMWGLSLLMTSLLVSLNEVWLPVCCYQVLTALEVKEVSCNAFPWSRGDFIVAHGSFWCEGLYALQMAHLDMLAIISMFMAGQ